MDFFASRLGEILRGPAPPSMTGSTPTPHPPPTLSTTRGIRGLGAPPMSMNTDHGLGSEASSPNTWEPWLSRGARGAKGSPARRGEERFELRPIGRAQFSSAVVGGGDAREWGHISGK